MRIRLDKELKKPCTTGILLQSTYIILITSFILSCTNNLFSQFDTFHFEHFPTIDNLENKKILAIIQDQRGFLWFGTNEGLYRYNGYEFDIYQRRENDANSISDNRILSMAQDQDGRIWIGTKNGGLNTYDPEQCIFRRHLLYLPEKQIELTAEIQSIAIDTLGFVWLGTDAGLYSYNYETEKLTPISIRRVGEKQFELPPINVINFDCDNNLWIGTQNGLCLYITGSEMVYWNYHNPQDVNSISHNNIQDLKFDSDGILWIGTLGGGLDKFDTKTKIFQNFNTFSGLSNDFVTSIFPDENSQIFVGNLDNNGINVVNIKSNEITFIPYESIEHTHGYKSDIYYLFNDRSGILWIGTDNGICRFLPKRKEFFQIGSEKITADSFREWKIEAICEDKAGEIWLGTKGDGLYYVDLSRDSVIQYSHKTGDVNSISSNTIHVVYIDNAGVLWVGTDLGLDKFNRSKKTFTRYYFHQSGEDPVAMNGIRAILQDHAGFLWLGMDGAGLIKFDITSESFQKFMYPSGDKSLHVDPRNKIISISEVKNDILWIGTWNGLIKFDRGKNIFLKQVFHFYDKNNDKILAINSDDPDNLWISASGGGISKFNPVKGIIEQYTLNNGLPTNIIYSIVKDKKNNLWMSSDKGIIEFNISASTINTYSIEDGLQSNSFNPGAFFGNEKGMLYFGSDNGFNAFIPEKVPRDSTIPPVIIADVFLENQSVPERIVYGATIKPAHMTRQLNIDPGQSDIITIEFAALDYKCPEKNMFMYKLDGYNEEWIGPTTNRSVSFHDLDYGVYTFMVRGSNNSGIWNDKAVGIRFEVLTPFWLNGWALTGYLTILVFMIYSLLRAIDNRMKLKQQLEYEHLALSRQKELDHLKSTFYTNISHDLRTPLTLIVGPLGKWLQKIKDEDLKNDLIMIRNNSNRMLSLIGQLFELSRIESGELKLTIQPVNIVEILKDLVISFSSMAEQKEINLSFTAAQDPIVLPIDRDKFGNIITNLVHNAFKHTPANGKISISVFIQRPIDNDNLSDQFVNIIVRDTGEGIPPEHLTKIFDRFYQVNNEHRHSGEGTGLGLALVREITELHHGTVTVNSQVNRGSTFTLSFPMQISNSTIAVVDKLIPPLSPPESIYQHVIEPSVPCISKINDQTQSSDPDHLRDAPQLLIVDDNADIRAFLRKCLKTKYRIAEAKNGIDGLEIAARLDPDLIISDVMMPEMDGYELCRKIKTDELTSHIPVILVTARTTIEDKIGGLEMGADDYIFKPFDSLELETRVKNLIVQRKKLRERFHEEIIVQPAKITVTSADHIFLQKVISIFEKHIADQHFETQVLADEVGMSRMNLHRKIKAITGQTPGQFISTMRLKRAAQLIKDHAGNVTEVAYDVGFNSLSYFARCFKAEFGVLPSEFIKTHEIQG